MRLQVREIEAAYSKLREVTNPYAHHVHLVDLDAFNLDGKNSETIVLSKSLTAPSRSPMLTFLSDADFEQDLNSYLHDLESSPVRTLGELIEFNARHADVELPPRTVYSIWVTVALLI